MEAIHRQIRDRALAAAEDPNQNTGEAAIRLLREWSECQAATPPCGASGPAPNSTAR